MYRDECVLVIVQISENVHFNLDLREVAMYDSTLTRQSLPSERYRLLLGTAIGVFNSNNGFVIENLLRIDDLASWYKLMDMSSGAVKSYARGKLPDEIIDLFGEVIDMRNRIIHSFQATNDNEEQTMWTKEKSGKQFEITEDYLVNFIRKNEQLAIMLDEFRNRRKNKASS